MQIHTSCRVSLSKMISEDSMVINNEHKVYGVFDGATPITPFFDDKGMNGAFIASNLFKKYFESNFLVNMTLSEGIIQANQRLLEEMILNNVDVTFPENLWSTCVALIKVEEIKISFAQLGDCMILAEYHDNLIKILTKDTVNDISVRAKARREKERQNGIYLPEENHYHDIKNQLVYNRRMANTSDGYTVANGTNNVNKYINHGSIDTNNLKSILLITDGLYHPSMNLIDVYKLIQHIGLEAYSLQLEKNEMESNLRSDDKA
ncbi:protein phosphatase 2C domain-containing protein, partial [Peribacillus frigoritolerans]|uniref:protein phosphatase 2C domain-containing protein n=1 Tax=Peribacillus frigoritolerans TaxID=450367 RepID=UPI00362601B3